MADAAFDVVIIGGGTKSMVTAIYLAKYGGLSVGVFEERRELCSGMTSEQSIVPGFNADYHSTGMMDWYWVPVREDFPDFVEKGGKFIAGPVTFGAIVREDQSGWAVQHISRDPDQTKTAAALERFAGQHDADVYMKIYEMTKKGTAFYDAFLNGLYAIPPAAGDTTPTPLTKWYLDYISQPDSLIDSSWIDAPATKKFPNLFNRGGLTCLLLRLQRVIGIECNVTGALDLFWWIGNMPEAGFVEGGTHNVDHAYQRLLLENGGKWFPLHKVDKIIVKNGAAKGIQLADGSQIEAKKMVISGVDPYQLCCQMLGKDHLSAETLKRVESLESNAFSLAWYTWFLHDLPKYKAASFDPEISDSYVVALVCDDMDKMIRNGDIRMAGKIPPIENSLIFFHYSIADKTRAPEGKNVVLMDHTLPGAQAFSERYWLDFKKTCAEEALQEWQVYAPNMTWDNVIGYAPQTPLDIAGRGLNFFPCGNPGILDFFPDQMFGHGAIPGWSQYRMPIKDLYATGTWVLPGSASCHQGYVCYKVIAEDHGLRKPWDEKGRPW